MARTRSQSQVSAVNNARTCSTKANARAGNTRNIAEAAPSPRKRKQDPPAPQPEDLPSQRVDPPAPISAQVGDTPSESTGRGNILKKGWLLLKAYLLDDASAGEVSDFLDSVAQPELQKVFSDIMGTENDDVEGKDALSKMVDAELEKLDQGKQEPLGMASIHPLGFYDTKLDTVRTAMTQKAQHKKRKTTFRPNFLNLDSASRPPKATAPKGSPSPVPVGSLPSSPALKGPSPSPRSSPTPYNNFGSKGVPSSSIPPSSPSPDSGFRGCQSPMSDNDETGPHEDPDQSGSGADILGVEPSDAVEVANTSGPLAQNPKKQKHTAKAVAARRTQLLSLVQKQRANARVKTQLRLAGRKGRGLAAKFRSKGKDKEKKAARKGKAGVEKLSSKKSRNANANDTEQAAVGLGDVGNRRGRLSKEVREQALALRQRYHNDLEALAAKEGKTVGALLRAVGDVIQDNRALNRWNAFQAYAMHPDGLNLKQKKGQTEREFQEDIRALYLEKRDGDDEEFDEAIEWFTKMVASQTTEKRLEGLSEKELQKLAAPFINRVGLAVWFHYIH